MTTLHGKGLVKTFQYRRVLADVSVSASSGDVIGIVGANGSGKSTLARILAGVLRPDQGTVELRVAGQTVAPSDHPYHVGMVAPYLQIYDEFTPLELLDLQRRLHGETSDKREAEATLHAVGLQDRINDVVRTFSSGLRQRTLLALAIHRCPAILILDEPTITLDDAGVEIVQQQIDAQRSRGGITLLATNDEREKAWCTAAVAVGGER